MTLEQVLYYPAIVAVFLPVLIPVIWFWRKRNRRLRFIKRMGR